MLRRRSQRGRAASGDMALRRTARVCTNSASRMFSAVPLRVWAGTRPTCCDRRCTNTPIGNVRTASEIFSTFMLSNTIVAPGATAANKRDRDSLYSWLESLGTDVGGRSCISLGELCCCDPFNCLRRSRGRTVVSGFFPATVEAHRVHTSCVTFFFVRPRRAQKIRFSRFNTTDRCRRGRMGDLRRYSCRKR